MNTSYKNHGLLKTRVTKGSMVLQLQCIGNDLNCIRVVLHKLFTESIKLLSFGKNLPDDFFQILSF